MDFRRISFALAVTVAALNLSAGPSWSGRPQKQGRTPRPTAVSRARSVASTDNERRIDSNNLVMYVTNTGSFGYDQIHSNASGGLFFPKGTLKTVDYASGIWLGATVGGEIRTAIAAYGQEFGPGPMLPGGGFDNAGDSRFVVYKVVRYTGQPSDTDHVERSAAELAADPSADALVHHSWSEYVAGAAPDGAPTRVYRLPVTLTPDPTDSVDIVGPDVSGDQMLWCVYNDADPGLHTEASGSTDPLGVEIQQTTFAFNRTGALGNTIFLKFLIINKGTDVLDNAFVSMWSDPDLGGAADDLVGCDTTLSLGYVYNATNADQQYGTSPPALGTDFFLGPRDTLGNVLGLSSFNKYINGTDPSSSEEAYNYMQGINPDGSDLIDPTTGNPTHFFHPGDPVTGTGWLDTNPADRRFLMSSGPFRLAPGDTQIVVASMIVARGSDRQSSITGLKFFDQSAQQAFDLNFDLPSPPPQPIVSVDTDHNSITLSWDAASQLNYDEPGYGFEGYNVYQGATVAGPWKLLATYDVVNGITVVRDTVFDSNTGQLISDFPVAFGGDNGLNYTYTATQDAVRGGALRDGTEYFYAVTAYSVGLAQKPRVLENAQAAIRIIPQRPASGTDPSTAGLISVTHTLIDPAKPPSTDEIQAIVVDADSVNNHCYRVIFRDLSAPFPLKVVGADTFEVKSVWSLIDVTTGDTLLKNQDNVTGDPNYRVFHGVQFKVVGAYVPAFQGADYNNLNTAHRRPISGINAGLESFGGGGGLGSSFLGSTLDAATQPDSFTSVELRFGPTQKIYRYFRRQLADGTAPAVGRGYVYAGYQTVNFQVWDVANNVQLDAAYVEKAITDDAGVLTGPQPATHDSTWLPSSDSGDGGREYFFVLRRPYSDTPKAEFQVDGQINTGGFPVLYALWAFRRSDADVFDDGDKFTFTWANPATANDVYDFCTSPLVRSNASLEKSALDRIRVVPNPYYMRSAYELNQFSRIVRFVNLPENATVRIFNLAGHLVRTLRKTDVTTSILQWDLQTERQLPVGSGIYIYHVDVPGVGSTVGRIAVFMERERLNNF
jgi:hypothetical protein